MTAIATSTLPQYSMSTDAEVIRAIQKIEADIEAFRHDAENFTKKHGDSAEPGYRYRKSYLGGVSLSAIKSQHKPSAGRWRKGSQVNFWVPFANNPVAGEMAALARTFDEVPGVKKGHYEGQAGGQIYWLEPSMFVLKETAFLAFTMLPTGPRLGEQWTEIKASEWHAAHEQWSAVDL